MIRSLEKLSPGWVWHSVMPPSYPQWEVWQMVTPGWQMVMATRPRLVLSTGTW